jgi:hypothetical protein
MTHQRLTLMPVVFQADQQLFLRQEYMSQADELEKLSQLKEKGVLTDAEFNAKKAEILSPNSTKAKKSYRLFWAIPLAIIGAMGLFDAVGDLGGHSKMNCESAAAKGTLQKAFDQSQFARAMNLSAIQISNATEQNRDPKSGELSCRATITLNTTNKIPVAYKMEQGEKGQFLLTFEVVDDTNETSAIPALPTPTSQSQSTPAPADFVASCVENFVTKFRNEAGEDVRVGIDMLDEWEAECKSKLPR